jgi:hypothetical protein
MRKQQQAQPKVPSVPVYRPPVYRPPPQPPPPKPNNKNTTTSPSGGSHNQPKPGASCLYNPDTGTYVCPPQ